MTDFITTLDQEAPEEGTYAITVSFFDDDAAAVVPTSATWTLTTPTGTVINSRSEVTISSLATSKTIVLSGNDLEIGANGIHRHLIVEYVYNSSLGSGLPGKSQVNFKIRNFTKVT